MLTLLGHSPFHKLDAANADAELDSCVQTLSFALSLSLLPRDYKSGWQLEEWELEKEWEEPEKARKRNLAFGVDDVDDWGVDPGDEVSLCKFHCRQPFVDLVVTKCKHYFCEYCALKLAFYQRFWTYRSGSSAPSITPMTF
ncbi:zinc finger CCCH domain-containing protein 1-like [Alnus glutinosa]|uniref:zinc finger CCCH domain-containing protein 1-like n=1 Tax=Alnus glutinosa TaxID=3517 RepID=UPI002D799C9C|nr:zinc finger CCCH domain-containing protein 1-like [Alnus glutinosa]